MENVCNRELENNNYVGEKVREEKEGKEKQWERERKEKHMLESERERGGKEEGVCEKESDTLNWDEYWIYTEFIPIYYQKEWREGEKQKRKRGKAETRECKAGIQRKVERRGVWEWKGVMISVNLTPLCVKMKFIRKYYHDGEREKREG